MKIILRYILPIIILITIFILSRMNYLKIDSTSIIGFATILLTYFYVVFTWEMTSNMKNDAELEKRPYIIPEISFTNNTSISLSIKNYGKTPAFNVKIQTFPDILMFNKVSINNELFLNPISIIPYKREIITNIGFAETIFKTDDFPKEYVFKIEYCDSRNKKYDDNFKINFDYIGKLIYTKRKDVNDIANELEKIRQLLTKK